MTDESVIIGGDKTILLKKAIAITLYRNGFDQLEISKILNLSQPMVSNYCGSKDKIPKEIFDLVEKISEKIKNGKNPYFNTCITFSKKELNGTFFIADKNEIINDENNKIVDNLTEAFLLLKGVNLSKLVPEVKINIAMSKENPKGSDDVAAFLNGLIVADEKITSYNGIRFGKSKHLSSLLLNLKKYFDINAIMNVAYFENFDRLDFKIGYLTKDFKLKEKGNQFDILLHKGDFGIEPCAYILGKNAVDVANKILKIREEIK